MKQKELIVLLQQPAKITREQVTALRQVIQEYPYFQAGRALLLKGLKDQNSLHYNKELKVTAAHTTDRAVLFDYISSAEFNQNSIAQLINKRFRESEQEAQQEHPAATEALSLDEALRMKLQESRAVFDPELFSPSSQKPVEQPDPSEDREQDKSEDSRGLTGETESPKDRVSPEESLPDARDGSASEDQVKTDKKKAPDPARELGIGQPLSFEKNESHSFSEWLKLTKARPIDRDEDKKADQSKERKFELIEKFISKNPRIIPSKTAAKANLAETQPEPEALMTETLARVYLEQKNYKKAIQAYKILILKNPEKSGFFADQIQAIKKLQEHNS